MSLSNPLQQAGVDLVVALIVNAGTGGDKTKKAARAQAVLSVVTALQAVNAGNVAGGLADLTAAIQSQNLDPGVALAVQQLLSVASTQLTALAQVGGATVVGQIDSAIAGNLLAAAVTACQAYIPAPAPAPAAAPEPSAA
jgi:hypothetical protein